MAIKIQQSSQVYIQKNRTQIPKNTYAFSGMFILPLFTVVQDPSIYKQNGQTKFAISCNEILFNHKKE